MAERKLWDDVASSVWFGLGMAGAIGFAVAVLRLVSYNPDLGIAVAAVSGAGAYYAFDTYYWLYKAEQEHRSGRRRPRPGSLRNVPLAPSFEVYDPRAAEPAEGEAPNDPGS